jgi:hypothetical protein
MTREELDGDKTTLCVSDSETAVNSIARIQLVKTEHSSARATVDCVDQR